MEIIKIIGIGLTALVIIIILKQYKPEFAIYISLLAGVFILIYTSLTPSRPFARYPAMYWDICCFVFVLSRCPNAVNEKFNDFIKSKNILIVDDVFTTGSTLNECSKVVKKLKPKTIKTITFAKTKFNLTQNNQKFEF